MSSYELGRWSVTFVDRSVEREFREHELPSLGRPLTVTLSLLALVFGTTFILDYSWFAVRAPDVLQRLAVARCGAVLLALLALFVVRRWPRQGVVTLTGMAVVAMTAATYLYISLQYAPFVEHSDSPMWYSALVMFALAGFPVPMRWAVAYAAFPLAALAIYLAAVHGTPLFDVPRFAALSIMFAAIGLALAHRENLMRRRQFIMLGRQQRINELLVSEVAERKRIEARLSDRTDQLEMRLAQTQRLESIALLAGGVAHDFNNLLLPIMGYAELAERKVPADSPVVPFLGQIQAAAERARDLTRQLLAFGRKQVLEVRQVDLNELVRGLEGMIRRLVRENIAVEVELEPELRQVLVDPSQIEQIVLNLVVNARDAMPDGGRMRIITANATAEEAAAASLADDRDPDQLTPDGFIRVSVADDGVGMDAKIIDRVFEPFFTTKRKGEGTGLGLAMVHGIVSQHHGRLDVTSSPGEGTCVQFFLPASEMRADSIAPEAPRIVELRGDETVLLVEDDEMVRDFARRVLESYGYRVLATNDGQQALDVASQFVERIDLLVTDVVMPKLSGPELWRELGKLRPSLRVLYISGYPDEELGPHGVLTRGIHFLPKPFKMEQLAEKAREALASGRHPLSSVPPARPADEER